MSIRRINQFWNPGFESPIDPALLGNPVAGQYAVSAYEDTTVKYSGNQSWKVVNNWAPGTAASLCYTQIHASDYIRFLAGQSGLVQVKVKRADAGAAEAWVVYANVYKTSDGSSLGALQGPSVSPTSASGWITAVMPVPKASVDCYMLVYWLSYASNPGATFNLDEMCAEVSYTQDAAANPIDISEYPFFSGATPSTINKWRQWVTGTQAGPSWETTPTYQCGDGSTPQSGAGKVLLPVQGTTVTRAQPQATGLQFLTINDRLQIADTSNFLVNGTDSIDLRVRFRPNLLTADSTQYTLVSKWQNTAAAGGSWFFGIIGVGPVLYFFPKSAGGVQGFQAVPIPSYSARDEWIRVFVDFKTAKTVQFYTSYDGTTWTALGSATPLNTDGQSGIALSTNALDIGLSAVGNTSMIGILRKITCINVSAGVSTTASIDFTKAKKAAGTTVKDYLGRIWSKIGTVTTNPVVVEDVA